LLCYGIITAERENLHQGTPERVGETLRKSVEERVSDVEQAERKHKTEASLPFIASHIGIADLYSDRDRSGYAEFSEAV
jgi:hypothetical protein